MADLYEIPLQPAAERFGVLLPDGLSLVFTVTWRNRGGSGWVLDIDMNDGTRLVSGLPLVTGSDLLAQHRHLGIPGGLVVLSDGVDPFARPTFNRLGADSRLYYVLNMDQ